MNTSTSHTLHLWGQGAVTLPKEWREQFPTKLYLATSTPQGLLIKPIVDIEYEEGKDGSVSLKFPFGIEASALHTKMKAAAKRIRTPKKSASRRHG